MHHVKWVSHIIPNIQIAASGKAVLVKINSWLSVKKTKKF